MYIYIYKNRDVYVLVSLVKSDDQKPNSQPVSSSLSPSATLSRTALTQSARDDGVDMSRTAPGDGDQKTVGKGWLTGDLPFSHGFMMNFDSDSIVIQ